MAQQMHLLSTALHVQLLGLSLSLPNLLASSGERWAATRRPEPLCWAEQAKSSAPGADPECQPSAARRQLVAPEGFQWQGLLEPDSAGVVVKGEFSKGKGGVPLIQLGACRQQRQWVEMLGMDLP
ncbi:hypothetical protein KIL84_004675 [Mauremys mutica]|uniref:Uncharacterized protein n=1 Tax=Mauremys mutica TaxID=74926 RepID=A0A9D3XNI1_9SAUR|nr:hypothetical protein KIL84_004675 [Mauremys mutica]